LTIAAVADTHTALWHLFDDARLSTSAGAVISEEATARRKIAISTISLAEVVYLVEKKRLPSSAYEELAQALADPEHVFTEAVLTAAVVQAMRRVSRAEVPDMPDFAVGVNPRHPSNV
jgi:PIN domain nuclease of toxin-antitoxin system